MPTRRRLNVFVALVLVIAAAAAAAAPSRPASAYTTVVYNGAGSAPRIGIIGDSTIAALRWTNRFEPLKRFNFVYDAESCRRTAIASCRGREGYAPANVISTMRRLSGQWGSVLVLMTGYDDPGWGFASAVDAVMTEAAAQGIPKVMWLTMRTADVSYVGPTFASNTYTFRDNNRILLQKSQQYGGRLQIADWATYSARRSDWFYSDGIHLNIAGSDAAATFIANQAARVIAGETVTPQPGVVPILDWVSVRRGDRGASVVAVQLALIERGFGIFGGADGVFGSVTQDAVRRFQRANRFPETGVVDTRTAARLGINNAGGTAAPAAWPELRYGSSGLAVSDLQRALIAADVYVRNGVTGIFDLYTTYAVQTFQRRKGLPATGIVNEATAKALGLFSGPWIDLRMGMSGAAVRKVQESLARGGIYLSGGVSGAFDLGTHYAVSTFQRYQRLPITGVVDMATARALETLVAPPPSAVWSNLAVHSRGGRIAQAQRALMAAGVFVRGGATGQFDVYTFYAVNTFQRHRGLPVTGIIDGTTARALGLFDAGNPLASWRDLSYGNSGPEVARLEQALVNAGVYVRGGVNTTFDVWTRYAVQTYQRHNGLPVTGVADYATAHALGLFTPAVTAAILSVPATALSASPSGPEVATLTAAPTLAAASAVTTTSTTTTTTTAAAMETDDAALSSEAPTVSIGDLIWHDTDNDGLQEEGEQGVEPGIEGIEIVLYDVNDAVVERVWTNRDGAYQFNGLTAGERYRIEVEVRDDLLPAPPLAGGDAAKDSDLRPALTEDSAGRTWASTAVFVADPATASDIDFGFIDAPPTTTTSTTATTMPPEGATTTTEVTTTTEPLQEATSTTESPVTTAAPTTSESPEPETTDPPATEPPATSAPSTDPPSTDPPATEAPPTGTTEPT